MTNGSPNAIEPFTNSLKCARPCFGQSTSVTIALVALTGALICTNSRAQQSADEQNEPRVEPTTMPIAPAVNAESRGEATEAGQSTDVPPTPATRPTPSKSWREIFRERREFGRGPSTDRSDDDSAREGLLRSGPNNGPNNGLGGGRPGGGGPQDETGRGDPRRGGFGGDGPEAGGSERGGPDRRSRPGRPTEEEMASISAFMSENLPNRWKRFQRGAEMVQRDTGTYDAAQRDVIMSMMEARLAQRYRWLMDIKERNPSLYQAALAQAKAEDEVAAAAEVARANPNDAQAREQLIKMVKTQVSRVLDERERRIETLQSAVNDEADRLEEDRNNFDKLVDDQIERLMSDRPPHDRPGGFRPPPPPPPPPAP